MEKLILVNVRFQDRKMITVWSSDLEEFKANIRRMFEIPPDRDFYISARVQGFGDEKTEFDPEIWATIGDKIKTVWVSEPHVLRDVEKPVQMFVKGLDGTTYTIFVRRSITVWELKKLLMAKLGMPVDMQRLIARGRQLEGHRTLRHYKIEPESYIHLAGRLLGGKPVIYLFSPVPIEARVSLKLIPKWSFSTIYPVDEIKETEDGGQEVIWDVSVRPDGTMLDKTSQTEVAYLYWEAESNPTPYTPDSSRPASPTSSTHAPSDVFNPARPNIGPYNSVLINIHHLPLYLDKVLAALGMHIEARTSFITYWLPKFLKHKHIALRFLPQSAYEQSAPLTVDPPASLSVRVFMLWRGVLQSEIEEAENGWNEAVKRARKMDFGDWRDVVGVPAAVSLVCAGEGLSVLEWGGMEVI